MGNLTALKIRNLKEPGRYSDGDGLILEIGTSGRGSWIARVQSGGKRRDIGLGSLSHLSLSEAREEAAKIRREIRAGIDPVAVACAPRQLGSNPSWRNAGGHVARGRSMSIALVML